MEIIIIRRNGIQFHYFFFFLVSILHHSNASQVSTAKFSAMCSNPNKGLHACTLTSGASRELWCSRCREQTKIKIKLVN